MVPDLKKEGPAPATEPGPPPGVPQGTSRGLPSAARRWVERSLLTIGLTALGLVGLVRVGMALSQAAGVRLLDAGRSVRAGGGPLEPGSVIGRMEIPRLGVDAVIREGTDARTLLLALGHLPGTALPGESGNAVVGGHRDSFFRDLGRIRADDTVRILTSTSAFVYRVESTMVVGPERTDLLSATGEPSLTLVTCYPFRWIGPAPRRFLVRARLIEDLSTPPDARVASAGHRDRAAALSTVAPSLLP